MATKRPKVISLRRKSKTDYRKRVRLLESGKPRLVIRKQSKTIIVQLVSYYPTGDQVNVCVTSKHLEKEGWKYGKKNTPACYLLGLMVGKKAVKSNIKNVVLDTGLVKPSKGSRLYAVMKGVLDAGIQVPHSAEILPTEDRITGDHITKFFGMNSNKTQFSEYKKNNKDINNFKNDFDVLKSKILGK